MRNIFIQQNDYLHRLERKSIFGVSNPQLDCKLKNRDEWITLQEWFEELHWENTKAFVACELGQSKSIHVIYEKDKEDLVNKILQKDMKELIDERRSLQSKRSFLINSHRGVRIICFVRECLLQKVCDYFTLQCHRKRKCCEVLKNRLKEINNKIENSEDYEEKGSGESSDEEGESGGSSDGEYDDKEDEDDSEEASSIEEESVEDVEAEGSNAEELDEKSEDESVRSTNDESSSQDGLAESSEDEDDSGIGEGYARKSNKDEMKRKIILDCGRKKALIWE